VRDRPVCHAGLEIPPLTYHLPLAIQSAMFPFRVLLAVAVLSSSSLAGPSLPSYVEQFPKGSNGKGKRIESHQTERYLDLPSLYANDTSYNLVPPKEPGTCVVICVMKPHESMREFRSGNANKDGYRQYACAPSCTQDLGDTSQPIKGEQEYSQPKQDGAKFVPEDFAPYSVVVTFGYVFSLLLAIALVLT
jgi:hypothetical protein